MSPTTTGVSAAYAHRAGAYAVEVSDPSGRRGVARVNPGPNDAAVDLSRLETGKRSFTRFILRLLVETDLQAEVVLGGTAVDPVPTGRDIGEETIAQVVERPRTRTDGGNPGTETETDDDDQGESEGGDPGERVDAAVNQPA